MSDDGGRIQGPFALTNALVTAGLLPEGLPIGRLTITDAPDEIPTIAVDAYATGDMVSGIVDALGEIASQRAPGLIIDVRLNPAWHRADLPPASVGTEDEEGE